MALGIGAMLGAGALLGGLSGSRSSGGQATSQVWGGQSGYLQDIYKQAQDLYGQRGQGGYLDPLERQGIQQGEQFYRGLSGLAPDLQANLGRAQDLANQNFNFNLDYANIGRNQELQQPYLQDIISQSTTDIYDQLASGPLKQASMGAAASGNLGSSRKSVTDAVLGSQAANQAGRVSADLLNQGFQRSIGIEQDRIGQEYAARQNQIGQLANFGQLGVSLGQQGIEGLMGLGQYQYGAPQRALSAYQQAIGNPVMQGVTPKTGGTWQDMLGGALKGAGTGLSFAGGMKDLGYNFFGETPDVSLGLQNNPSQYSGNYIFDDIKL